MNKKVLETLEYNKIIDKLVGYAVSPMGKEMAAELRPSNILSDIELWQNETSEAETMLFRKGSIPLGGAKEIRPFIKRLSMGGVLGIAELLNLGEFLYACRRVKNYSKNENKSENYVTIGPMFELIVELPKIESEITRSIISETEVSDDASIGLRSIRREIAVSNDRIREHLNGIINSQTYRTMLQDYVITIRNDRYCVPVKSEYRNSFGGMIHDQSNTGSTLFIEPLSVVQLNNKIKELRIKENEEIEKILQKLSALAAENIDVIESNLNIITKLDFIFAKGQLSISMKGTKAIFNNKKHINIKKARHPLLNSDSVVPIDIYIGEDFTTLLITGPNTGGKTVALKTLGLFQLMGQAGLHIPAFDNSKLGVFDEIFADIGDEQSIEQNLSTFSAHMKNTVYILNNVTDNSLVLFDELGAGTDPVEGAALAMSIIQSLKERNIITAVTTHYSELKVYALSTNGVENASCEFDVESLKPTYRLLTGIPGKSNAFAISKRLGLNDDIIEGAKKFIGKENVKFEDVITDLEISRRSVVIEQERAEQYRIEAEKLKNDFERQKEKTRQQKEKILSDAREQARMIYQKAKEEADAIIKQMNRDAKNRANQEKMNTSRKMIKEKLSNADSEISKILAKRKKQHKTPVQINVGDRVYIISFDQHGIVVSIPDENKNVMVQMGTIKMQIPLSEIVIDETSEFENKTQTNKYKNTQRRIISPKSMTVSTEIDCRGQTVDEGIGNIDKYIDDAFMAGLKQVTIIHGKGTGVLREAVQRYLSKNPNVKTYRYGKYGEGEMGVTIVELKN